LTSIKELEEMVKCMDAWAKAQQYGDRGIDVIEVIDSVRKELESSQK
jgi:hypothetical protein